MYQEKILPAEEALAAIKKGSRVFMGSGCGEPQYLVDKLGEQVETLFDVEIIQVLSVRGSGLGTTEKLGEHFSIKTFFIVGGGAREAVWAGRAEYTPIFMSQVPRLFSENLLTLDCALVQVSPPNAQGYMSLGIAVDVAHEAVAAADLVIAQVNPAMPVTLGNSFIHVSDVDTIVEYEEPILEVQDAVLTDTDRLIGGKVASLVEDGATIHAGLGPLPQAALEAMKEKKDLGVHTDMLTNSYLDLIRRGVITNRKKGLNPNRIVAAYCVGTKELFDFVHLNPFVEFQPISYTNDPFLMGQHHDMTTIHEAWEVDLTGLVCAAGHGHKIHSGVGGLVDFMRGAYRSKKGKCVIALNAASRDGRKSRILPTITPGSAVMTSRAGTQYVVTQFGSANLHGKSLRERAVALIEIAHPRFREELYNQAQDEGLLSHDEPISLFKPVVYPQDLEKTVEIQGESLLFRPAKASDLRAIQEFFYGLNDQDVHLRFMRSMKAFPRKAMAAMANIDYHHRMTLLALKGEAGFENVAAISRYTDTGKDNLVEVDVAVAEEYRRHGLGRLLVKYLLQVAKAKGFAGMLAKVAHDNPKALNMLKTMGYRVRATLNLGVFELVLRFDEEVDEPEMEIIYPQPGK